MSRQRRAIVEVSQPIHRELRKLALLNDLKVYEVANALLEDCIADEERVNSVMKKLKV